MLFSAGYVAILMVLAALLTPAQGERRPETTLTVQPRGYPTVTVVKTVTKTVIVQKPTIITKTRTVPKTTITKTSTKTATVTKPASTLTKTATITKPASTLTRTATITKPASTIIRTSTLTQPASTIIRTSTLTQPASTIIRTSTVTKPASTLIETSTVVSISITTMSVTLPASTSTVTETTTTTTRVAINAPSGYENVANGIFEEGDGSTDWCKDLEPDETCRIVQRSKDGSFSGLFGDGMLEVRHNAAGYKTTKVLVPVVNRPNPWGRDWILTARFRIHDGNTGSCQANLGWSDGDSGPGGAYFPQLSAGGWREVSYTLAGTAGGRSGTWGIWVDAYCNQVGDLVYIDGVSIT